MKANELRIGNYYNQFGNIHQVSCNTLGELEQAPIDQLWCKPIPLTEYWLLDFGFIIQMFGIPPRFYNGKLKITKDYRGFWVQPCYNFVLIKYVHQLQNLYFELTGEELTLKN